MRMIRIDVAIYWVIIALLISILAATKFTYKQQIRFLQYNVESLEDRFYTMDNMSLDNDGKIVLKKEKEVK